MRSSDILTLLQAGYTKAEIEAMDQPAPDQTPAAPAQTPEAPDQTPAAPAQTPEAPAQTQPAPAQNQEAPTDGYAKLENLLNQLIGLQQNQNINHVNMGSNYEAEKSTTDILASVIAPKKEK